MKEFKVSPIIQSDLQAFDELFSKELSTKASILKVITNYILKTKGKQLRPILVFLGARLVGEVTKSTFSAAYMIELMHTATLIHDDVVDNSMKRRGFFSINAMWKNKIAVLIGDYYLAKGLLHAVENKEYKLLEIVAVAVKEMSEGELLQIEKARSLKNSEEIYFEIIRKKTATLFVAAMSAGAASSGEVADESFKKIQKIAELLGIAFQIKDDLLDYTQSSIIGKPTWNDIKEQKITLPLMYALSQASANEQKHIKSLLKTHANKTHKLKEIVDFVVAKGGIAYAQEKMDEFCSQSIELCMSFPSNEAQSSIIEIIKYVSSRNK